ncbi:hypothetical protein ACU18_16415, partial [Arthrobacter sp. ZBG10]
MDIVFWIILIVVIVGVVWWLMNRSRSSGAASDAPQRPADGALSGGSSAASAAAAGTTGIPTVAGFGQPAGPAAPTTAEDPVPTAGEAAAREVQPATVPEPAVV